MPDYLTEIRSIKRRLARLEGGGGDVLSIDYGPQIATITAQLSALAIQVSADEARTTAAEARATTNGAAISGLLARPVFEAAASAPSGAGKRVGDSWGDY